MGLNDVRYESSAPQLPQDAGPASWGFMGPSHTGQAAGKPAPMADQAPETSSSRVRRPWANRSTRAPAGSAGAERPSSSGWLVDGSVATPTPAPSAATGVMTPSSANRPPRRA